jgi:KRAB domain-containing zinc finger protein
MSGTGKRKELEGQDMEKKHGCDECGKYFAFVSKLKLDSDLHMLTHTGEKPWVCETCDKEEEPHVCLTCDKKFSDSSSLDVHLRTHTGDRPRAWCGVWVRVE